MPLVTDAIRERARTVKGCCLRRANSLVLACRCWHSFLQYIWTRTSVRSLERGQLRKPRHHLHAQRNSLSITVTESPDLPAPIKDMIALAEDQGPAQVVPPEAMARKADLFDIFYAYIVRWLIFCVKLSSQGYTRMMGKNTDHSKENARLLFSLFDLEERAMTSESSR